jgi:hypothetical protein
VNPRNLLGICAKSTREGIAAKAAADIRNSLRFMGIIPDKDNIPPRGAKSSDDEDMRAVIDE